MSLLFGMPEGISDELESALAAIQTWAGKQDGIGKWQDIPFDSDLFAPDSGTWTVAASHVKVFKWAIVNSTMTVAFHLSQAPASSVNVLYLRVPAPYKPVQPVTNLPTLHGVAVSITNACGIWRDADDYTPGLVGVVGSADNPPDSIRLAVMKLSTGAIDNVDVAGCFGQISFDVVPVN